MEVDICRGKIYDINQSITPVDTVYIINEVDIVAKRYKNYPKVSASCTIIFPSYGVIRC